MSFSIDNNDRAALAQNALETFMADTNCGPEDAIADLLADIMHLCDLSGGEDGDFEPCFDEALHRARYHYDAEVNGEE